MLAFGRSVGFQARALAFRLEGFDLDIHRPCHGYANACVCEGCKRREELKDRADDESLPVKKAS